MQTVCFRGDTYVLTVDDDLDVVAAEAVSAVMRTMPARRFIVDLTKVGFLDENGVEELARGAGRTPLSIVTDDPRIERVVGYADCTLAVHARLRDALA